MGFSLRLIQNAPRLVTSLVLFSSLALPLVSQAAPDAALAKKAANGDAAALVALRAMAPDDLLGSLKAVLGAASENEKKFITKELLRIGTDEAMAALSPGGEGAGTISAKTKATKATKGNQSAKKRKKRGKLNHAQSIDAELTESLASIEKALASRAMKSTPADMKPFVERAAALNKRLVGDAYSAGKSDNPELHVISVYEAELPEGVNKGLGIRVPGHLSLDVTYTERPVTLLLCAYDAVVWNLSVKPGVTIDAIFLSGYHDQDISGVPDGVTVERSSHKQGGNDKKPLDYLSKKLTPKHAKAIEGFTGMPATTFQTVYRAKSFQVGPESDVWRTMHTLHDAKSLISELSGKAPEKPSALDVLISGLDDEESRDEAVRDLLALNTPVAKEALLEWAESSLEDSDDLSFMEAFSALSRLEDKRVMPFLIGVIERGAAGQLGGLGGGLSDMQLREAHKAVALKARSGDATAITFLLDSVSASLAKAKDNAGQAYADLHRLDSVLGNEAAKAKAKVILQKAAGSDIELIKTTASRLLASWKL